MEGLMGIFLKENWQISMLLQLNLLKNKKTNKLMADEKTNQQQLSQKSLKSASAVMLKMKKATSEREAARKLLQACSFLSAKACDTFCGFMIC